jgi:hypothetical protein
MEGADIQSILQLGFAAGVAAWLIRWLTLTHQKMLDKNTSVLLNLQLQLGEMYRLLLLMDLQLRSVEVKVQHGETQDDLHAAAVDAFNQTIERLDAIKTIIEKSLQDHTN